MKASLRFCARQGCHQRVEKGYCALHKGHGERRLSAHRRGYTAAWERFRLETFPALLIARDIVPVCGARLAGTPSPLSECARDGLLTFHDLELHHEPPLEEWERAHQARVCDPHRVVYLCKPDHTRQTAGGRGTHRGDLSPDGDTAGGQIGRAHV